MRKVTLYQLESSDMKISMEIYFNEQDQLIFDGYDIGKRVEELLGDSDYEYSYTVEFIEVNKISRLFNINITEKSTLLMEIKNRFNGNDAYSKFGDFMTENNIKFSRFTWR